MNKCNNCEGKLIKVIYAGLPMKLCENESCNSVYGFWSFVPELYFNGYFVAYEGSYFKALWFWLKNEY